MTELTVGKVVEYLEEQAPSWVSVGGFLMRYEGAVQLGDEPGQWKELD